MDKDSVQARREKVGHVAGIGCLIQAAGLLAPFGFYVVAGSGGAAVGLIVLVVLFFVGSAKAVSWRCGSCKNPLSAKAVKICPVCHASLK